MIDFDCHDNAKSTKERRQITSNNSSELAYSITNQNGKMNMESTQACPVTIESLERASENRDDYIRLALDETSNLAGLAKIIPSLDHCYSMVVLARENEPNWMSHGAKTLFQALGKMPNLRVVTIEDIGCSEDTNPFPIVILTQLLKANQNLANILMDNFSAFGSLQEFEEFEIAVANLKHLEIMNFEEADFIYFPNFHDNNRGEGQIKYHMFDQFFSALASLNELEHVSLRHRGWKTSNWPSRQMSLAPLQRLCSAPKLQSLVLGSIHANNPVLMALLFSLLTTKKNLKKLELFLEFTEDIGHVKSPVGLLARYLSKDSTLSVFKLEVSGERTSLLEECFVSMAEAIGENSSYALRKVEFRSPFPFGPLVGSACSRAIELNCGIMRFCLAIQTENTTYMDMEKASESINLYEELNQRGRQKVMQHCEDMSRMEWLDTLSGVSDNLDCLYYYLHMNPWLCHASHSPKKEVTCKHTPSDIHEWFFSKHRICLRRP